VLAAGRIFAYMDLCDGAACVTQSVYQWTDDASFEHFVLTRFNVRESADKTDLVLNPVWLQFRFDLFERFCWPSVRAQTTGAFTWLVFFDKDTPEPFRARTERYAGFRLFGRCSWS
jgi:hypothetical protein